LCSGCPICTLLGNEEVFTVGGGADLLEGAKRVAKEEGRERNGALTEHG